MIQTEESEIYFLFLSKYKALKYFELQNFKYAFYLKGIKPGALRFEAKNPYNVPNFWGALDA